MGNSENLRMFLLGGHLQAKVKYDPSCSGRNLIWRGYIQNRVLFERYIGTVYIFAKAKNTRQYGDYILHTP